MGGFVRSLGDVIRVAEVATSEYALELEGVKVMPGVQWGGGVAWTDVRNVVHMHLGNIGW